MWWECRKVICNVHDPIFRTDKESSIWHQNDHRDIMQNLSEPFIFQEECRMKIEHVLFPSVFFKVMDPCIGRSFSMCSHDRFSAPTKIASLKTDRVKGPLVLLLHADENFSGDKGSPQVTNSCCYRGSDLTSKI